MRTLKNHPQFSLREDAAEAFDRVEALNGVFHVTSAARTISEQEALIARWKRGGVSNRPPYLYHPAEPPETSAHVRDGGVAIDIANYDRFAVVAESHGFIRTFSWDVVHFEYFPERDQFKKEIVSIMSETERIAVVLGGTVERAQNGESISQRIDELIKVQAATLAVVERVSRIIGSTEARAAAGDTLGVRLDRIVKATKA